MQRYMFPCPAPTYSPLDRGLKHARRNISECLITSPNLFPAG